MGETLGTVPSDREDGKGKQRRSGTIMNGYEQERFLETTKQRYRPVFILGIVSIASLWFTLGISGVVFGIIGIVLARKHRQTDSTNAGFVLCLISLVLGGIVLMVVGMCLLVLLLMPDSIGAYYIQDLLEILFPHVGGHAL